MADATGVEGGSQTAVDLGDGEDVSKEVGVSWKASARKLGWGEDRRIRGEEVRRGKEGLMVRRVENWRRRWKVRSGSAAAAAEASYKGELGLYAAASKFGDEMGVARVWAKSQAQMFG